MTKKPRDIGASVRARIEARISPEGLKMVRRAAEIQGRTISDFVVAAAHEAAQRTISEVELLKLSRLTLLVNFRAIPGFLGFQRTSLEVLGSRIGAPGRS